MAPFPQRAFGLPGRESRGSGGIAAFWLAGGEAGKPRCVPFQMWFYSRARVKPLTGEPLSRHCLAGSRRALGKHLAEKSLHLVPPVIIPLTLEAVLVDLGGGGGHLGTLSS